MEQFRKWVGTQENIKKWASMSKKEIKKFKAQNCESCYYYSVVRGNQTPSGGRETYCGYAFIEDRARLCTPLECKELGLYKSKKNKKVDSTLRKHKLFMYGSKVRPDLSYDAADYNPETFKKHTDNYI